MVEYKKRGYEEARFEIEAELAMPEEEFKKTYACLFCHADLRTISLLSEKQVAATADRQKISPHDATRGHPQRGRSNPRNTSISEHI